MSKNLKKIGPTLILFIIFISLIIIYFLIPKTRTVIKEMSTEEYKNQIYDDMYKQIYPEKDYESENEDEIDENEVEEQINEDELLMMRK